MYGDHDVRSMFRDPDYMSEDAKLFLLAKAQYILEGNGKTYAFTEGADINEQLGVMGEGYAELQKQRAKKANQKEQERVELLRVGIDQAQQPEMTEEEKRAIIERKIALLEHKYVKRSPYWNLDSETIDALEALNEGRSFWDPENPRVAHSDIAIFYETATGAIGIINNEELLPGSHSFLSTELSRTRSEEGSSDNVSWNSQRILLVQPGTGPTRSQFDRALLGPDMNTPDEEKRRVLPQRVVPRSLPDERGRIEIEHVREPWGESAFTPNVEGDSVLLRTVQRFNAKYGPQG